VLRVLPDGQVASTSYDNMIRLWDPNTCAETARMEGHSEAVTALCARSTSCRSHWRHPRLRLRTRGRNGPMVAEIPEGIGPPRPGSGMGGLAEALFVIAIEPVMAPSISGICEAPGAYLVDTRHAHVDYMRVSAVSSVVKVLQHSEFSF
jgi:hypothetical protein